MNRKILYHCQKLAKSYTPVLVSALTEKFEQQVDLLLLRRFKNLSCMTKKVPMPRMNYSSVILLVSS